MSEYIKIKVCELQPQNQCLESASHINKVYFILKSRMREDLNDMSEVNLPNWNLFSCFLNIKKFIYR